jgi:hypothetical protein
LDTDEFRHWNQLRLPRRGLRQLRYPVNLGLGHTSWLLLKRVRVDESVDGGHGRGSVQRLDGAVIATITAGDTAVATESDGTRLRNPRSLRVHRPIVIALTNPLTVGAVAQIGRVLYHPRLTSTL